ncbi:hypothetical protein MF406_08965 [Georgenia sp. TF02-10]|uniref:hypothetical protein n=1 Tax=Georgenia sp. TF02-10 TaxID=2917725 RepID=UPI001FA7BE0A|nr:hypothetical protein [Georgenia sp. TF02-10]UNX53168.1 hypothetical protein MF406_08965 [Georgenia sp. TF02-10]
MSATLHAEMVDPPYISIEVDPPYISIEVDPPYISIEVDPPYISIEVDPPYISIEVDPPYVSIEVDDPVDRVDFWSTTWPDSWPRYSVPDDAHGLFTEEWRARSPVSRERRTQPQ